MAVVKFADPELEAPAEKQQALVTTPAPDKTLAAPADHLADDHGASSEDYVKPFLKVDKKTGSFVLGKDPDKLMLGNTLTAVVLDYRKVWVEYVDMDKDPDKRAQAFSTEDDAIAAGFRTVDKATHREEGTAIPNGLFNLWIGKPEKVAPEYADAFSLVLPSGLEGQLVAYSARGTSYNTTFKNVHTDKNRNPFLKTNGIFHQKYTLFTTEEKYERKEWMQARVRPAGRLDAADAAYLGEFAVR